VSEDATTAEIAELFSNVTPEQRAARWKNEIEEWYRSLSEDMVAKTKAISNEMMVRTGYGNETEASIHRRKVEAMDYDAVFPMPGNVWKSGRKNEWADTNMPAVGFEKVTVFNVDGEPVPDWMYGFAALEHRVSLPEAGTEEEMKDSIFGVMQDCVARKARDIRDLFDGYRIMAVEFQADFVNRVLYVRCVTNGHVMAVNNVMTNKKVRKMMSGRVIVQIHTQVEQSRRTDDYLHPRPARQHIVRTFVYEDQVLIRNEPESWSAGSNFNVGDVVHVSGVAWRVGDDPLDSLPGFVVRPRPQDRAALSPRERAYAKAARNR
jgi:hypothetical protein